MNILISRNGQQIGSFSLDQVNLGLANGTVLPTDHAWAEGQPGWVPVSQFPGVMAPGFAAFPDMTPLPPSASSRRRTRLTVGLIVGGVVVLGIILVMVGLIALGRASQGDEGVEFAKLHSAYKTKIMPMEVEVIKLVIRLNDADDEDELLSIMGDINANLTVRNLALKTIDLNHYEIEELNDDYIDYCEKSQQMWMDVIRQYEIGNYQKGDDIVQKNMKRLSDDLADWIKRFNRLCAKHGLPDLETIMEEL